MRIHLRIFLYFQKKFWHKWSKNGFYLHQSIHIIVWYYHMILNTQIRSIFMHLKRKCFFR